VVVGEDETRLAGLNTARACLSLSIGGLQVAQYAATRKVLFR
jgi:hypothetical protein